MNEETKPIIPSLDVDLGPKFDQSIPDIDESNEWLKHSKGKKARFWKPQLAKKQNTITTSPNQMRGVRLGEK